MQTCCQNRALASAMACEVSCTFLKAFDCGLLIIKTTDIGFLIKSIRKISKVISDILVPNRCRSQSYKQICRPLVSHASARPGQSPLAETIGAKTEIIAFLEPTSCHPKNYRCR